MILVCALYRVRVAVFLVLGDGSPGEKTQQQTNVKRGGRINVNCTVQGT